MRKLVVFHVFFHFLETKVSLSFIKTFSTRIILKCFLITVKKLGLRLLLSDSNSGIFSTA